MTQALGDTDDARWLDDFEARMWGIDLPFKSSDLVRLIRLARRAERYRGALEQIASSQGWSKYIDLARDALQEDEK